MWPLVIIPIAIPGLFSRIVANYYFGQALSRDHFQLRNSAKELWNSYKNQPVFNLGNWDTRIEPKNSEMDLELSATSK